jgi:hypothetical protein
MRKLYTFNIGENAQAGLVKDLIEKDGIPCVIRNDQLSTALGPVPFTECYPELWILRDEDYPKAKEVLDGWLTPRNQVRESWICANCGETIEGQFISCWKCGRPKEGQV